MKIKTTVIALVIALAFGIGIGWLLFHEETSNAEDVARLHSVRQGGYRLINPLLECEIDGGLESTDLQTFKGIVSDRIDALVARNPVNHISLYYRDLDNGPWFGINEHEPFAPASLLKVPTMIAYLKKAQNNPPLLATELPFVDESGTASLVRADELIRKMIVASDNDAFHALAAALGDAYINEVHTDLGLEIAAGVTPEDFITVKNYASLFRVLYNSSYLSRTMSEYALEVLLEAEFDDGLTGGLPESIAVANKYGITGSLEKQTRQLHDCGIVYYPEHPYLLCVMTRGENTRELASVIAELSQLVYEEVDKQYGQ